MLIPTSPGYELDPDLQETVGLLSLTLLSAGLLPSTVGSLPGLHLSRRLFGLLFVSTLFPAPALTPIMPQPKATAISG